MSPPTPPRHGARPVEYAAWVGLLLLLGVSAGWGIADSLAGHGSDGPALAMVADPRVATQPVAPPPDDGLPPTDLPPDPTAPVPAPPQPVTPAPSPAPAPPPSAPGAVSPPAQPASRPHRSRPGRPIHPPRARTPSPAPSAPVRPSPAPVDALPPPAAPPAPAQVAPPAPSTAPVQRPATAPAPPALAPANLAGYTPPPVARIPAAEWPDVATARAALRARADAASGRPADDLRWLAELDRRYGGDADPGRRATVERALRANGWWYTTRGAPLQRVILRDPDGVILTYREGHGFMVNPVATSGRWRGLNDELSAAQLAEVLVPMGVARPGGGLAWEYYDVPTEPAAVRPGVSGMAQARLADMIANAYHQTGDVRFAEYSRRALVTLADPVADGGATSMVTLDDKPRGPWFVERAYPGEGPWRGAALNGFMAAILSVTSASVRLDSPPETATQAGDATTSTPFAAPAQAAEAARYARGLAAPALTTLRTYLPEHDTGRWSLYGIDTPGRETSMADLNYHCYHVYLLRALARAYADDGLAATADRWQGYVDSRGASCPDR